MNILELVEEDSKVGHMGCWGGQGVPAPPKILKNKLKFESLNKRGVYDDVQHHESSPQPLWLQYFFVTFCSSQFELLLFSSF